MKSYNKPIIEIVEIKNESIITTSGLTAKALGTNGTGVKTGVTASQLGLE